MSLLNQASPYTENGTIIGKRQAKMKNTLEFIENEFKEPHSFDNEGEKKKVTAEKVNALIHKMNVSNVKADNDGGELGNYHSPKNDLVPGLKIMGSDPSSNYVEPFSGKQNTNTVQKPVVVSTIEKNPGSSYNQSYLHPSYYKNMTANATHNNQPTVQNSQLMEKLNYMIHLLEEQQKEQTQNILEEFVLYGLLGVFMIYLIDSFTKVGKYTR